MKILEFEIEDETYDNIQKLVRLGGYADMTEMFKYALATFEEAINATNAGHKIFIRGEEEREIVIRNSADSGLAQKNR